MILEQYMTIYGTAIKSEAWACSERVYKHLFFIMGVNKMECYH